MLDKPGLISDIEAAFRSVESGVDSVSSMSSKLADAFEAYVKSGKVVVNSTTGMCSYSGTHPPLSSEGSVI